MKPSKEIQPIAWSFDIAAISYPENAFGNSGKENAPLTGRNHQQSLGQKTEHHADSQTSFVKVPGQLAIIAKPNMSSS